MIQVCVVLAAMFADGSALDQMFGLQPGVTKANVQRIQPGVTRQQVRAILGGPAQESHPFNAGQDWLETWISETGVARVSFQTYRCCVFSTSQDLEPDEWLVVDALFWGPEMIPLMEPSWRPDSK
jgi:hypothetical protein